MISIDSNIKSKPLKKLISFYCKAHEKKQQYIEAACLSTSSNENIPDSRFLNIKYINESGLIFFTNYNSPKAIQLDNNPYISLVFFWSSINTQIRIKAYAEKLSESLSDIHFKKRNFNKNILSISSNQSCKTKTYEDVVIKYEETLKNINDNDDLKRPKYWGGYNLKPSYFEFWQGEKNRINKREVFEIENNKWKQYILEP